MFEKSELLFFFRNRLGHQKVKENWPQFESFIETINQDKDDKITRDEISLLFKSYIEFKEKIEFINPDIKNQLISKTLIINEKDKDLIL